MQHRMKESQMNKEAVDKELTENQVGHVATIGADGFPYVAPVFFLYQNGKIYFHGLKVGQKLDNIKTNSSVGFETEEFTEVIKENLDCPCDADAVYQSVVVRGRAKILEGMKEKEEILRAILKKYAPEYEKTPLPEARIRGTAVVEINPVEVTGKYHTR